MPASARGLQRPFAHFHTNVLIRLNVRTRPRFREPLCERHWCRSTPGVLGSGPSSVVSVHRRLLPPHPPVSQARGDFTALPLIRRAFGVRERRGDPRDLPYFPCRAVHACRRPYAGGFAVAFPLCSHRDARLPRAMTESPPTSPRPSLLSLSFTGRSSTAPSGDRLSATFPSGATRLPLQSCGVGAAASDTSVRVPLPITPASRPSAVHVDFRPCTVACASHVTP